MPEDELNGLSLHAYCKRFGFNYATVRYRLLKGLSLAEACVKKERMNIRKKYGVLVYERVKRGYTLKEALSPDFDKIAQERHFERTGKKCPIIRKRHFVKGLSLLQYCKENDYSYEYALALIQKRGFSPEEVIEYFEERGVGKRRPRNDREREETGSC